MGLIILKSESLTIPVHITFKEYSDNSTMIEVLNSSIVNAIILNKNAMEDKTEDDVKNLAPKFSFKNVEKTIMVLDPKKWFNTIKFTDKLISYFDTTIITQLTEFQLNDNAIHIDETFFIYCDIIQDQYVGDTMSPLLRTVRTSSDKDNISIMYENPHYLPIKSTRITTINIRILDHFGKEILFSNKLKRTIVKLHFKPLHGL